MAAAHGNTLEWMKFKMATFQGPEGGHIRPKTLHRKNRVAESFTNSGDSSIAQVET